MQRIRMRSGVLHDVPSFRVIVKDIDTCYRVLGIIHELWNPKPSSFKDYIAVPKPYGYMGLHTMVFGPRGQLV